MIRNMKNALIKIIDKAVKLKIKTVFVIPYLHKKFIEKKFKRQLGYQINFKKPGTFTEKIQWLKLYGSLEKYSNYVDKNKVRRFVQEIIGESYLIPKIGVYKKSSHINYESLPEKFVIKATHGSGWNMIVKDKSALDWEKAKKEIDRWLSTNYFYISGEKHYKKIKGRVIIEELLDNPDGNMKEYKFYCYHGQPHYVVAVNVTQSQERKKSFYDVNWQWLKMNIGGLPDLNNTSSKPAHFQEMLDICRRLSKKFPFVRVDLYENQGRIYVGELTFTPNNGFGKFSAIQFDELFGRPLILSKS